MIYLLYRALARLALHLFFRQIEVEGRRNVPSFGPVLFVPNHSNSLVDPLVLVIGLRRRLTVTAKNVLARNPLLGWLMSALGVITFHRREDVGKGAEPRKNVRSLERCREVLAQGGALCIFPEGVSHSDPGLRPFHLGPAKIALDFLQIDGNPGGLKIVPVGLLYTEKDQFRSRVWLRFGAPIEAGPYLAEHPETDARHLTEEFRHRVESLTLNYQSRRESLILTWAADIVATGGAMPAPLGRSEESAAEWFRLLGRLQAGYRSLLSSDAAEIDDLSARIRHYRSELKRAGIDPAEVYLPIHFGRALLFLVRELELMVVGFPLAAFGAINHFLPYTIVKLLARKLSTDKDHWASNVVYPSFAIFPLFYAIQLAAAWLILPTIWAALYTVALPYTGSYAILYGDRWKKTLRRARTFAYFLGNRGHQQQLAQEGRAIIDRIRSLAERLPTLTADGDQAGSALATRALDFDSQFRADAETFLEIADGLDRLEAEVEQARPTAAARERGYFTPDEDDRVRQLLLTYRNYRLALYEIIERNSSPESTASEADQIRGFMVGFAAATTLCAKSLRLIEAYENEPLARKKLNEPDAKFGIAPGFFDGVIHNYSSPINYRLLRRARRAWLGRQRDIRESGLEHNALCLRLCEVIRRQQAVLQASFWKVLPRRLRSDWRLLARSVIKPLRGTRYGLQAFVVETFSTVRTTRDYRPAIQPDVLDRLRPDLQPGDILLVRSEQKITTALLPGFWMHAAIYLGDRSDLGRLVLGEQPRLRKLCHLLPEESRWGSVLEAISPRVTLNPLEKCLQADHVVVLRPKISDAERRDALVEAFGHHGKPYDFEFDFNVTSRIVCTELVYRSWHLRGGISFPLTKRLGRFTLSADDIMDWLLDTLENDSPAAPVPIEIAALVLEAADGQAHFIPVEEAAAALGVIRRGLRPSVSLVIPHDSSWHFEPKGSLP